MFLNIYSSIKKYISSVEKFRNILRKIMADLDFLGQNLSFANKRMELYLRATGMGPTGRARAKSKIASFSSKEDSFRKTDDCNQ